MPDLAVISVMVATVGGSVALYNAHKGALWKRAELANSQLKELLSNEELVFACRCLDWNGGILVVPAGLRPLLPADGKTIDHDTKVFQRAIDPDLLVADMARDPRLQIYRTATDTLLGWLSATESAIGRHLYRPEDIQDAGYWLRKIYQNPTMIGFIEAFGYDKSLDRLASRFGVRRRVSPGQSPDKSESSAQENGFGC